MTGKKPDIKNIKAPEGSSHEIFNNVDNHEIFFVNYSMLGREIDNIRTMLQATQIFGNCRRITSL